MTFENKLWGQEKHIITHFPLKTTTFNNMATTGKLFSSTHDQLGKQEGITVFFQPPARLTARCFLAACRISGFFTCEFSCWDVMKTMLISAKCGMGKHIRLYRAANERFLTTMIIWFQTKKMKTN